MVFGFFLIILSCTNSKMPNEDYKKIDTLFKYVNSNGPGYALGIVKNGELIYSKGYGIANLDYNIPLSDSSAFYIGSMAKQFTAAALLILESEEKLDFKKNVNDYLSDFPTYKYPITVEHLIHHISGIRETNSLQLFKGIDRKFEEVFTTEDLYELIVSQEGLNFQPGSEYRYSSGGYAVLAKIVEEISGMSFRSFLQKRIFTPLQMKNTFVSDNHNEITSNRVISYWPSSKNNWERRSLIFDAYGDGGIITTIKDLAKWDTAFYNDLLGVENFSEKMYQQGILNNNEEIEYARALQVRTYKGQKMITHNGGMLGFRVDMVRFPEQKTSIILLGNSAFLDPTGDALRVADILFKDVLTEEKISFNNADNTMPVSLSTDILKEKEGYYWTDEMNYFRRITFQNDSLFIDSGNSDYKTYLVPLGENEFYFQDDLSTRLFFTITDSENYDLTIKYHKLERNFRLFNPEPPVRADELTSYQGIYKSEELKSTYKIFEKDGVLSLQINNNDPVQIFPTIRNGVVWNGKEMLWIGFGEIKFKFNSQKNVIGLTIGDQRVSGVPFKKINNAREQ